MRIGIVGAGALGSVFGGLLFEAGLDPVLIERDPEEVSVVRNSGLWLEGVSGDRTLNIRIVSEPAEAAPLDLALVLVKSYDTKSAVSTVRQAVGNTGLVLTLQNGIGNYEILNDALPGRVLLGTTTLGAMTLGKGRVRHTGFGQTHLGEEDGSIRERTSEVGEALEKMKAGPVHVVDNAVGCVWSKLIVNAAINAPATLLRVRNGDLPADTSGQQLISDIVEECLEIINARGIKLVLENPKAHVLTVCQGTAPNVNSMLQDIRAGRRTEIDFINGALAKHAEALKISAPVNKTLALLIKSLEATSARRVPDPADHSD
jgi:2-dehydropantoate 2-reductase